MSSPSSAMPLVSRKSANLTGTAEVPGDKSISHRALILGALAVGETTISGLLEGEDVLATARAVESFGAETSRDADGTWRIHGVGVGGFAEPDRVIDCGNSGTGVRLLIGAMATTPITATFTGDASLCDRPMGRIVEPLEAFGAQMTARSGGRLPMTVCGAADPVPAHYELPMASAQVKSAILLAGLNAPGKTVVIEREPSRDHTERMLADFGATVEIEDDGGRRIISLTGYPELSPRSVSVPRDPSSAAFPACAALICEGSDVLIPGICLNPTRSGLFDTLIEMGADIAFENERIDGGERVADLRARFSPALTGVEVPPERASSMIDEYPVLCVVAAFAEGSTSMLGVGELRAKETDRIDAMATALRACGVDVDEKEDQFTVHGRGHGGVAGGCVCETRLDHRIAMSALVMGMGADSPVSVDDGAPIRTSFPGFESLMRELGGDVGPQ